MCGPMQQETYANKSSSSSRRRSSSESSPLRRNGVSIRQRRGKVFQLEMRLWVKNDLNAWHIAKIRQHTQDPTKSAGRSGFEGGFVSHANSDFAELLRRTIRGARRTPGVECFA